MNKKIPLSLLFLIIISGAHAQIKLGAFIGAHSANVIESNNIPGWDTTTKPFYSSRSGISAGILLDIPIGQSNFYFQPGINYSSKGRQYNKSYDTSSAAMVTDSVYPVYQNNVLKLGYIEMPLNIAYKIPLSASRKSSFFISAGPYFAFIYSASSNNQSITVKNDTSFSYLSNKEDLQVGNAVNKYKTIDIGVNAKAGFEFGNVILSCYASRGLTNFYTAPYSGSFHHQVIGASLGIWIGKTQTKTAAPRPVKIKVKDSDKDGIPDDKDLCPNVPGLAKYNGCPIPDTDGDGIDDEHDSCRTVPGIAKYHGCPIPDTDGDGIDDEHDSCRTVPGVKENNGCPAIKKEIKEKVNYVAHNILFATASDRLTTESYLGLDELVAILKNHPELKISIEGYTDTVGTPERNVILSQKRADAVKNYLIFKGVEVNRVSAIGHGQEQPIEDNSTEEGRSANRRVELKLTSNK